MIIYKYTVFLWIIPFLNLDISSNFLKNIKVDILFINIEGICQYWMDLEKMTLSTPDFPKWTLREFIGCEWIITTSEGNIVILEVQAFDKIKFDIVQIIYTYINMFTIFKIISHIDVFCRNSMMRSMMDYSSMEFVIKGNN